MSEKNWKILKRILIAGSVLAALKVIFFDYTLDEEYQIVMAYRNITGDALFREMWEPHQTSAFFCAGLMWLYQLITGTLTGVVLFLRVCTTIVQVLLTLWLYKALCKLTEQNYAFLLALIYFNVVPKIIQIPEFSNLQLWFFTCLVLLLMEYYNGYKNGEKGKWYLLVPAGISMALEVLAYPSCLILFPFFLLYIGVRSMRDRWRDMALFAGTCGVCGTLWLLFILSKVSLQDFLRNLKHILSFDLTHEISGATAGKGAGIIENLLVGGLLLLLMAAVSAIALLLYEKKKQLSKEARMPVFWVFMVTASGVIQLFYWVVLHKGYEVPQIHLLVMLLAGIFTWKYADDTKKILFPGIVGSLLSLLAVIYISDLEMFYALPHGLLGPVFCTLVLVNALQKTLAEKAKGWCYWLLAGLTLLTIFGKGYTLRGGGDDNTILETRGIIQYGPAAGIATDYMNAYIYNANYEDFTAYVENGEKVLIVTNMIMSAGTTPYLFVDADICHYSIVDPTAYDERLLTYWELYPEKYPDVIVVDCWYGQLMENPDNWIMQYIEKEFGYTETYDGKYVRFYRR